jgi:hypothetical protein
MSTFANHKNKSLITIILIVVLVLLGIWLISHWISTSATAKFINVDYTKDRVFYLPVLVPSPTLTSGPA